jgi:hypothetical protein
MTELDSTLVHVFVICALMSLLADLVIEAAVRTDHTLDT